MQTLPFNIGIIHFIGIGGIGMSGIAEVLHMMGYKVQGSDISDNDNVKRLKALGIPIFIGHNSENIKNAAVVVVSTAIKKDNPEAEAARNHLIPVVRRAEMLAELMRLKWSIAIAGTHGKTTTTSLVACILENSNLDPTVINGGIIEAYGSNTRMGSGDWMVIEADESDGSFLRLPAIIAVVTNMDPEHLDHWGSDKDMEAGYEQFLSNIPFYGFTVLCVDHPRVQQMMPKITEHRVITYGFSPQADFKADNVRMDINGTYFDIIITDRIKNTQRKTQSFFLPMFGHHNLLNALAAIAVAMNMDINEKAIQNGLKKFKGVKRRFTKTGTWNNITIIDDYGHHPIEISSVLKAARQAGAKRIIAIMQPHRYSRLKNLFEEFCTCFNDADAVMVTDIYAAGEPPIEGINKETLVKGLRSHGHRQALYVNDLDNIVENIHDICQPGDYIIFFGAGNITKWAHELPKRLHQHYPENNK